VLILVRHGQTVANAEGRLAGRGETPLTPLGEVQAAAVASAVLRSASGPLRVVTSPLKRARATAAAFGLPMEVDARWVELDYGSWDGLVDDDVPAADWVYWREHPDWAPPGGESLVALGERVRSACEELAAQEAEGTGDARDVVVVSHVSPIKAAVAWALGVDPAVAWRTRLDPASVTRVGIGRGGPVLRSFNETAHLAATGVMP